MIPRSTLDQIRAANDIVDVIGAILPLKRAGGNFRALCPFHKEKTPSFNVNPHLQIFHCFGCGKGGDVFKFIQEYEALSFAEAIKRLADRAGIPIEFEQADGQQQARAIKDKLLTIHEQLAQRWQMALKNDAAGQIARDYLAKRGVSPEAVELFRLGYSPDGWDDTVNWAKSKGFDLAVVEQGGLLRKREGGDGYYSWFRGRLMFPICDEQGRIIAFSGRALNPDDDKMGKYVNSPETPIFTKGKVFYGLDKSKRAILDAGFAIVCEGQLDLIACYMAGVQNIVAPQGTAFTDNHARILKRYANEMVLCFDADQAGKKAAIRGLEGLLNSEVFRRPTVEYDPLTGRSSHPDTLLSSHLAIRVVAIPSPHDPDSFIRENGADAFKRLVANAPSVFDFYLDLLCQENDLRTDKGRIAVVKNMGAVVCKSDNRVLLDTYAQKTAQRLGVSPESVRAEFKKAKVPAAPIRSDPEDATTFDEAAAPEIEPPSEREFWLTRFVLLDETQTGWVAQHLDLAWLRHPVVRRIVTERLAAYEHGTWHDLAGFLNEFSDEEARGIITEAVAVQNPGEDLVRNLVETVIKLRSDNFDRRIKELTVKLNQPEISIAESEEIEQEKARLRALKNTPLAAP